MSDSFRERVVIITGGSSGIGAELARQLGSLGARVGLTARRVEKLEAVADQVRKAGGYAAVAPADAADSSATRAAIGRLIDDLGPPDVLIVNAGIGRTYPVMDLTAEAVEGILKVNAIGAVAAIEAVLPHMLMRRQGQIVGISSLASFRGLARTGVYAGSKAFLSTMLESLRVELKPRGIAVTTVHPGYIRTPMTEGSRAPQPFLMDVEPATRIIVKGIAARRRRIDFPWPAAFLMGLGALVPAPLFDFVATRALPREDRSSRKAARPIPENSVNGDDSSGQNDPIEVKNRSPHVPVGNPR